MSKNAWFCALWLLAPMLSHSLASAQRIASRIPNEISCSECRIIPEKILTLGNVDGPGAIGASVNSVQVDGLRRYWVFSPGELPSVFGPDGVFVRTVGRLGDGPGEMRLPFRLLGLPGDSVAVVELGGRLTVFDSRLNYVRTVTTPLLELMSFRVLNWPNQVLVNGQVRTRDRIGWPLHILDLSRSPPAFVASFGRNSELLPGDAGYFQKIEYIAGSDRRSFWTLSAHKYSLVKWGVDHRAVTALERAPEWFKQPSDGLIGGPSKPPSPRFVGLSTDTAGLLWVFALTPASSFKSAWDNVAKSMKKSGRGEVRSSLIDFELLYNTRIEIIDPQAKRVLATTLLDQIVHSVLPDQRVAVVNTTPEGKPEVQIIKLTLVKRRQL